MNAPACPGHGYGKNAVCLARSIPRRSPENKAATIGTARGVLTWSMLVTIGTARGASP